MRKLLFMFPLLLMACAADDSGISRHARHSQRIAEARPVGDPVDCVELSRIRSTRVLDDRTIDFELLSGAVLRNRLPNSCPGLGFEESFSYSTSLSRLCSVDIITVLHQGGGPRSGASCGLGKFQPVSFPAHR